jgi:hypothetical protein
MGTAQALTKDTAAQIYKKFKEVPLDKWLNTSDEDYVKGLTKSNDNDLRSALRTTAVDAHQVGTSFRIFAKMANQLSESEFCDALITRDFPPLKLTPQEMEVLRGGIMWTAVVGVGVVGGLAVSAVVVILS